MLTAVSVLAAHAVTVFAADTVAIPRDLYNQLTCERLLHQVSDALSQKEPALAARFFTEDAVFDVDGEVFEGRAAIARRLARFPPTTLILLTTVNVTPVDTKRAEGTTYALALLSKKTREDDKPYGTYKTVKLLGFSKALMYRDTFAITPEGCRIARRTTVHVVDNPTWEP